MFLISKVMHVLQRKITYSIDCVQGDSSCNFGNNNPSSICTSLLVSSSFLGVPYIFGNFFNTPSAPLYEKCKGWKPQAFVLLYV